MVGGVVYVGEETGFRKTKFQSAEFRGKELNYFGDFWGWDEDRVNGMDYTIGAKLLWL